MRRLNKKRQLQALLICLVTFCLMCDTALSAKKEKADEEEQTEEAAEGEPIEINYYRLKPSLVTNLLKGGKYIKCDVQFMVHDDLLLEQLTLHTPAIRHTLLMLLSEQDGRDVKTISGKGALRQQALEQVDNLMLEIAGVNGVKDLFFTTFYVQ